MARLFFALRPDAASRTALAGLAAAIAKGTDGRLVPVANLHLTLVFVGEVEPARIGALVRAVRETAGRAFTLVLDRVGGFRSAGVAWVGCRVAPPELVSLQQAVQRQVRNAGFPVEDRVFAPHLTLARRVRTPPELADIEPIPWRAQAFELVESVRGKGAYRTLAQWPLEEKST